MIDSTLGDELELKLVFEEIASKTICDSTGCIKETSAAEKQALIDFYTSTNGPFWVSNYNWLIGDPCINAWFGVMCNKFGQIIALNFYENSVDGIIPDSIVDLKYLVHFNIWNDGREYEYIDNAHKNSIYVWNTKIHDLLFLEELNF